MKTSTENEKERLRRDYVLDRLAEEEKYEYEEICFTDMDELTLLEVTRDEVIDDYLTGALSPDERRSFESYFLSSPGNRLDVAMAKANRKLINEKSSADLEVTVGAASSAPELAFRESKQPASSITSDARLPVWRQFIPDSYRSRAGFMAAVAILLVVVSGYLWFQFNATPRSETPSGVAERDTRPQNLNAQEPAPSLAPTVSSEPRQQQNDNLHAPPGKNLHPPPPDKPKASKPLVEKVEGDERAASRPGNSVIEYEPPSETLRAGAGDGAEPLEISESTGAVRFLLKRPPADYSAYSVMLMTVEGQEVWHRKLTAAASAKHQPQISVLIPANILRDQDYLLVLSGFGSNGNLKYEGKYSFRVVKKR
jgi:hypothetical protein